MCDNWERERNVSRGLYWCIETDMSLCLRLMVFGVSTQFSCAVFFFFLLFSSHLCASLPFRSFFAYLLYLLPSLLICVCCDFFLSSLSIYFAWDILKWISAKLQLISLGFMVFLHFHPYSRNSRCHCRCCCCCYSLLFDRLQCFFAKFISRTWILWSKWVLNKKPVRICLPSCVFMCARRLQASANFLLHKSQECGLSPVNFKENRIEIDTAEISRCDL